MPVLLSAWDEMNRLVFEHESPVVAADPNRADIACFVGFIAKRKTPAPAHVMGWLREQGWTSPALKRPNVDDLLDVPVPIETWEVFDQLFQWDQRILSDSGQVGGTYMGAAVRSYFAQGGRKCYVVRVGDPWIFTPPSPEGIDHDPEEVAQIARCLRVMNVTRMIPGFQLPGHCFSVLSKVTTEVNAGRSQTELSPADRSTWHGIGHLFGLPEVSFLCLPDLVDAVRVEDKPVEPVSFHSSAKEVFVECSERAAPEPGDRGARFFRAPRCDLQGYRDWATALNIAASLIARYRREVQLLAAIPIPEAGSDVERDIYEFLAGANNGSLAGDLESSLTGLSSAFVQLAYPWVRTLGSSDLPEGLESPDAVLAGILARNALTRGAFHSAASLHLADVYDVSPPLRRASMWKSHRASGGRSQPGRSLIERVSLFGRDPDGLRLLSDVTTSLNESYRPAGVNRLVSSIVRAARRLGEESIFEPSGEELWARLCDRLNILLSGLYVDGALRGESEADAFQVRCDRSTMSQNDIDNGRVVAEIRFQAAVPIEVITIVLALDESGQVSLVSTRAVDETKEEAA
ncbi:MAG TPA: hypothetical protein VEW46_19780 [Pyrinomonadaceae bacterium]|nr:hypothetical protein [Pyrinomonadaceae bacterium]